MSFGESGSYSEALYDLHAASFLYTGNDQLRFTLPISTYDDAYQWSHSGLHLFEVNGLANKNADLKHVGEMIAEQTSSETTWPSTYQASRSVLHDEAVYYLYGGSVFSSFWSSPQATEGPN